MKNINDITRALAERKSELKNKYHVRSLGVFGSYARGDQREKSDLDVLVEFDQPVGMEIVDLRDFLNALLEMKVDLVSKGAVKRKPQLLRSIEEDLILV